MFQKIINMLSGYNKDELVSYIKNNAFLVDVRTPEEFAEGHVSGSTNIPLDQVENQLEKFKNHSEIVVFCRSGNRSGQAKVILENNGFIHVLNGGTWQNVNDVKAAIQL
ncbi:rhodanese-like domain-containing protein [Faecalibacter sp. LW9]|uniref:rhodanese-like domain-containing protein n=1 Tax=Faecalibacter sp. LW9 TaxID=3103144 RepID=UPI002B000A1A|nr:rhodanese-like domain-containing protein [Faecalibacter sp. LW9]